IAAADSSCAIDEDLSVAQLASCFPDNVLQPARAPGVATELEFVVTHHIEQYQCVSVFNFILRCQLRDVMATAVSVVRIFRLATLVPAFAERLFTIEEN